MLYDCDRTSFKFHIVGNCLCITAEELVKWMTYTQLFIMGKTYIYILGPPL